MDKCIIRKSVEQYKHNRDENITTLLMLPSTFNLEEKTCKKKEKKNQCISRRYNYLKFGFCIY